jgi:NADH-quinone oxidoreductase subunit G
MAAEDQAVNEEWNCDKGRWAFTYATLPDRVELPMVRDADGELQVVGWPEALAAAAAGLAGTTAGVLVGGRVSAEDAYAYGKFARVVLGTNDVDFRARPHSAEEVAFLAEHVAATGPDGGAVTYADLEAAKAVLLVGFEPEDESPIVFLRLRKAFRKHQTQVYAVASHPTRGLTKVGGTLLPTVPGHEAAALADLGSTELGAKAREALGAGGVVLVGERLATSPGALRAAADLAAATGARLAWVPRRAGERGALEAGALGALLPGGRPVSDASARAEVARVWDVDQVPATPARDTAGIVAAAAAGEVEALLVGGVDPTDLGDPAAAAALETAFVVSLELRESPVTAVADVVLPVAPQSEKTGTYVNWEGRVRAFEEALESNAVSDHRALDMLASEMGVFLETRTQREIHAQFEALGPWGGARATSAPDGQRVAAAPDGSGDFVLSSWATLLDAGRMQDGEPFLAGTAPLAVARLSAASAAGLGLGEGDHVTVSGPAGSVTLPAVVTEGMVDGVVWVPTNAKDCSIRSGLGTDAGGRVHVTKGGAA